MLTLFYKDEEATRPQEATPLSDKGREEPNPNQPTDIASVIDAVSKSVETALRNLLVSDAHLSLPKRSPQRRRKEDTEVELEKQIESSKDRGFILVCCTHCPPVVLTPISDRDKFVDSSRNGFILHKTLTS